MILLRAARLSAGCNYCLLALYALIALFRMTMALCAAVLYGPDFGRIRDIVIILLCKMPVMHWSYSFHINM